VFKQGTRRSCMLGVMVCALFVLGAVANASAATVYVSNSAPLVPGGKSCVQPNYSHVQNAINAAGPGTLIQICPGTYTEQIAITNSVKLNAISGAGTATLEMPESAVNNSSACDTMGGLQQMDEISICTSGTVSITGVNVKAVIPVTTCAGGMYGIFVGGGGTLKATNFHIDGASTSLNEYKGCQKGVAIEIGNKTPAEVAHGVLKQLTVTGYQKNGPTVKAVGSTMSVTASTITGEGATPYIAQNGVEVAWGAQGIVKSSHVSGNECNVGSCGATGEQASGVLFYQAAAGSNVTSSTVSGNDMGVYYASGSATVPASPDVTIAKDAITSNRYEGVLLEEGKASLTNDKINGTGRVGIDLYQAAYQESASQSSASYTKIEGQAEAAIKVESDKEPADIAGKFTFANGSIGNGTVLLNESNNFEVIF